MWAAVHIDHRSQVPVTILGPKTGVPTLAAARMQRWALILASYQYDIEYRKSAEHANADAMSRLAQSTAKDEFEIEAFVISYVDELPITAGDLASATRKDPVLARVYDMTLHGWPQAIEDPLLQPYFSRREELSVDQGCVLWGLRVVIPGRYQDRLLDELHQEHHGICRMKSLARGYLWWSGLDADIAQRNGVKFTHVPPYHPASNGAAERSVQTTKVVLAKQVLNIKTSKLSLEHRLANFLIMYRSTPHTVTGQSPAQLFLRRQIRNSFTLLKPSLNKAVDEQQINQKQHHDEVRVKARVLKVNEVVLVRNWRQGVERWIPGRITQVKGPRTYLVRCGNQVRFVHVDHLKSTACDPSGLVTDMSAPLEELLPVHG
ncbi:hypothetical protein ACROYT_G012365 [Oculina patagonica]